MSQKDAKRPRDNAELQGLSGRAQLLITSAELQGQLGQKYIDESELAALLLSLGLVRRVRTLEVLVRPLGGDSFKIRVDCDKPTVGEAKSEIARVQGTKEALQELYRVAVREDGQAVREDDAEPELLEDASMELEDGAIVAMAVKEEAPLKWRTFAEDYVSLNEDGMLAMQTEDELDSLTTTGIQLTEGRHYWEVEIVGGYSRVGVTRPYLVPKGDYSWVDSTSGWFMNTCDGVLCGNGKEYDDAAGSYNEGDRVGVLLNLNDGSIHFFKNGVQHGPGYAAGSVTGPTVHALQMYNDGDAAKLLLNSAWPAGHGQ
jgi:hypothetical protein